MEISRIKEGEGYYQQLIPCDWCGKPTHGVIRQDTVQCTSCHRVLVDLDEPRIHNS